MRALAVTVSNRAAAGVYPDRSGPVLADLLRRAGCAVVDGPLVIPDGDPVEEALRDSIAAGYDVVVKKDPFGGNSRARIIGDTEGLVKVIAEQRADGTTGRILGVHMAGPWVTEQLGAGYLAVNWEATPEDVAQFIQPHPSLSEAFGETVLALTGRGLHVA